MDTLLYDLRYAIRALRRRPGFVVVAILALALGIGASTAIFSVANAVLLRPLPYEDPDRLALVWQTDARGGGRLPVSIPDFRDWRDGSRSFEHMGAFANTSGAVMLGERPRSLEGAIVSADMFRVLGVAPVLGRAFLPAEDRPGTQRVIVLSHALWRQGYGADPAVIGRPLRVEGREYVVVGVMPPAFRFLGQEAGVVALADRDFWMPLGVLSDQDYRGFRFLTVVARVKAGVAFAQAQAEMNAIARSLEQAHPQTNTGSGISLVSLMDAIVEGTRPALLVLLGAVGLLFLIACANVANLFLARAVARQRELAVRTALGASRSRVARQLLTESLVVSFLGGAAGLVLAFWGLDVLRALAPEGLPRLDEIRVDGRILAFAVILSFASGIAFGLAPALQLSGANVGTVLRGGRTSEAAGAGRSGLRGWLVVSELALALALLVGAGLLIRSFVSLLQTDPGFQPEQAVTMQVSLPWAKYEASQQHTAFYRELLDRIKARPGVSSAGGVSALPMTGADRSTGFEIEGRPVQLGSQRPLTGIRLVTPDYHRAIGIELLRGRPLTEADGPDAQKVVLVNETFVRRFFPGDNALGKRIRIGWDEESLREIVGVVSDVRHFSLDAEATPETYVPFGQATDVEMTVVVRTTGSPESVVAAVREEVRALDPALPVTDIRLMAEILSESVAQRRFNMQLLGLFAGIALILAVVGIYGVLSYSVTQRTNEIGVRMALGARQWDVLRLVVGQGMRLTLLGLGVGSVIALALTRLMTSLVYGVSTTDPLTFAAVALLLAGVALLASYVPARRAARVDPMVALRAE